MKISLSALFFFQVLCYQVPCFIQQYAHTFLGFPFVVEILIWKSSWMTFLPDWTSGGFKFSWLIPPWSSFLSPFRIIPYHMQSSQGSHTRPSNPWTIVSIASWISRWNFYEGVATLCFMRPTVSKARILGTLLKPHCFWTPSLLRGQNPSKCRYFPDAVKNNPVV